MEGNVKKTRTKVGLKPFGEVANFAEPPHFSGKLFLRLLQFNSVDENAGLWDSES